MKPKTRVLVIDDDPVIAASLKKELDAEGYDAAIALCSDAGLATAQQEAFDVIITDLSMPGLSGLELLDQLHAAKPKLPIILMTAYGTSEAAIEAIRRGACEYLTKPVKMRELLAMVAKAVACEQFPSGLLELGAADSTQPGIVGSSQVMQTLYKEIGRAAQANINVLIRGETGTGKELVARAIHQHSSRAAKPFIAINCTAIPDALLESELFGHERGAFTNALACRIGRFEQANGGTLFLDEIGDLSPATQVKLLRVLAENCIQRVGGNEKIPVDTRVLAATHRDLETAMKDKLVRRDLFYRLSPITVRVPPLRDRLEDIPDLVRHCMSRFSAKLKVVTPAIQLEAVDFLQQQPWHGNVRELENVVQQALLLAGNHPIAVVHVQAAYESAQSPLPVSDQTIAEYLGTLICKAQQGKIAKAHDLLIEEMEQALFAQTIKLAQGNQAKAARWLGVTRKTLRVKLAHFGLHPATTEQTTDTDQET